MALERGRTKNSFWRRYFGAPDKREGIVDAEDKSDVKQRLDSYKNAVDKEEIEVLQKKNDYQPKFSEYLFDKQNMIGKMITLKSRRNAGKSTDRNGM